MARAVLLESQPDPAPMLPEVVADNVEAASAEEEPAHSCLEKCLGQLSASNGKLILQFYTSEKENKIDIRKDVAQSLGISVSALRIRAHRIRTTLRKCVSSCLEGANDSP